ncbi:conserved Plasmodium protein, unknown function [Plasmodium malariae]|uniref:CFAP65-like ninth Ig-like domain-containing protein n=1 Tax=Plasmodium malariae TaxID=5858 RepID=A0A1A8W0N8_PLAMA|nr:conserved Plasmodium protein, unknown function [Plasmodium malariae]
MENCRMYGLEFSPSIEFNNYEGGVKVTKKLNIKNTTKNIVRFRFLFQISSYFTYPLQEIENISPGLSKNYFISFLNPLNDFQTICETLNILIIEDKQKEKKISIKLTATPLKCDVIFSSVLNFNEMVIKQKTIEEMEIKNQGTLNTVIKLSHKNISKDEKKKIKIKIEPSQFILKANQKQSIHINIYSEVPRKYKEYISCSIIEIPKQIEKHVFSEEIDKSNRTMNPYENEEKTINDIIQRLNQENVQVRLIKKKIEMNWVSVLPQINILWKENGEIFKKSIINFGQITLGQKITKTIILQNLTGAPIKVEVKKHKENNIFTILNEKFTMKGKTNEEIILNINGHSPVNQYTEIIQFKACNDYCIELFLICEIKDIKLYFSKILYQFENMKLGDTANDKIIIRNEENIDLDVECISTGSFFNINNKRFIIKKNSFYSINLTCDCIYPINVYKRLYFLVHLNKQIFYIDVIFPTELEVLEFEEKDLMIINKTPIEYTCVWSNALGVNRKKSSIFVVTPSEAKLLPFGYLIFRYPSGDSLHRPFFVNIWAYMHIVKNVKSLKEKYTREVCECIVFPSNNKDYTKCNSKTLLPPIFLYVTVYQFKIKYLCETENVAHSLFFFPKHISFLNMIEEENTYAIAKFENSTDNTQIIDFTQFKSDVESIRVYPLINYIPKKSFLNVVIFYSPKKRELAHSEIKVYYVVNGIEKKYISVFVSHEINNVVLNRDDPNINLPYVSIETESTKKVPIENMTERNVLCLLIKEDADEIVNITIEGKKDIPEQEKDEDTDEFEDKESNINKESSSLINKEKKYNFFFFCLLPFEKKNLHISAFSDFTLSKSVPLLFTYALYINDTDMENKFTYLKKNMRDHMKSCKKFVINVNIIKCSLTLHPKIIESKPIICGKQYNAKIRIHNEHPVKVNFKTKAEIVQVDNSKVFDEEEIKEAGKDIIMKKNEDVINAFSDKYFYVSFNTKRKGRFIYRFFTIVGDNFKTPTSIYWNMISADKINEYLKDNISKVDIEYKKNQGMQNMKKLFNQFNYIEFNIGNNMLNEITRVNIVLYNPLDTSLNVQINTIKSYILPILPPYVKNQEEKLAHILYVDSTFCNFMRCLDSCEINPTKFKINKKGTKIITLLYKNKYIGFHNMPLIIDVENGKVVPLNLCSLTFHPKVPPIYLMNIKDLNHHVWGLQNECIINVDLLNDSELDIFYEIEQNDNLIVLNPKGIIKRRKYISLFILISRLSPSIINETLIMKSYFKHLQKDIELNKIQIELKLNSTSNDIYKNAYKKINMFNNKYIMDSQNQNIKTSCSHFLPSYSSLIERIVIIKNYSPLKSLKFKISNKNTLPGNILKIYPHKGIVERGEQTILRFSFILNDILLDIEGNIQIELKFIDDYSTTKSENGNVMCNVDDSFETNIEDTVKKDNLKEPIKQGIKKYSKYYFYIHVKLFTCNCDDAMTKKSNFENLIQTNVYPKLLYFKKYMHLPMPLEDKSKRFFKRHYFDFDKLEKLKIQNEKEKEAHYKQKFIYQKRDIYCCMFSEMFKSIIKKHIKKNFKQLFDISACSIQTIDSILKEDLIDTITSLLNTPKK